jgi:hypothetical protein
LVEWTLEIGAYPVRDIKYADVNGKL